MSGPQIITSYTFASAHEDGPWLNSTRRFDAPYAAPEAAAAWIVECARNSMYPRVRVQPVREVP